MADTFFHHAIGNGGDIGAVQGGIGHIPRTADAGGDDLGFKTVAVEDLTDLTDEDFAFTAEVVESADKGTYIGSSGTGGKKRLRR